MRLWIRPLALGLGLMLLAGCGAAGADGIMKELLSGKSKIVDVLKSIKDVDSAKAAIPQLEPILKQIMEWKKKLSDLKLPEEAMKKIQEQFKADGEKASTALKAEETRLTELAKTVPDVSKILEMIKPLAE